jgi:hypothetical protein
MIFLKMVSDNGDVTGVTEESVNKLVESYLPQIEQLINKIRERIVSSSDMNNGDLYEILHASRTMEIQIDELMRFAGSMGLNGREIFSGEGADEVTSRAEGKEVVARVRSFLTHLS